MTRELPDDVEIGAGDTDEAAVLADLWIELADGQRRYGSHLRAEPNRTPIHETMLQHAVTGTVLVARRDDAVVGFVTFGVGSGRYRQDTTRGTIHNLYVRKRARGAGIGGALLTAAEDALASMDVETVSLEAMAGNDAARSFYSRHGYAPHRIELEKPINDDHVTTDED